MKLELTSAAIKWAVGVGAGLLVTAGGVVIDQRAGEKGGRAAKEATAPLAADVANLQARVELLDAGLRQEVREEIQSLREDVKDATKRMEKRSDDQEILIREVLKEVQRKR
jgi:hypothetical protein